MEAFDDRGKEILFEVGKGSAGLKENLYVLPGLWPVDEGKAFPKHGFGFFNAEATAFAKRQLDLALRHVNSEPRGHLNGNCPGEVARAFVNEKVLGLNEYRFMPRDRVNLTPGLVK